MWLTGFDAPSLHTMYVDKPMRGHGLMQAIARVNRVFKDKPGGLVVDYLGLADELKQALATYTESGGTGETALDQDEAVARDAGEVRGLPRPLPRLRLVDAGRPARRRSGSALLPAAQEHILAQEDGKDAAAARRRASCRRRSRWRCRTTRRCASATTWRFFQAVRAVLAKRAPGERKTEEELDHAVRQIISRAVASDEVVDIFAAAGLKKPDISILSDEFLAEVRGMPQRNLAVELLQKLLKGEIRHAAGARTSSRRARSPRCWSRRSAATRTAPSRRRR